MRTDRAFRGRAMRTVAQLPKDANKDNGKVKKQQ
jgi:hypothetical protein